MKKVLLSLCLGLFIAQNASAVPSCGSSLMPAFTANQATSLCKTFGSAVSQSLIPSADNTYDVGSTTFGWRTGYFDTSVITPLVSHATSLALGIAGTAEATVTNDTLTFSGAAASIVGGATSITLGSAASTIIKADADAQRLFTWDASSDTALTQTFGDGGTTAAQALTISASTAAGDDDSTTCIAGGGACTAATRGSYLLLSGEESASVGAFRLGSANTAGALNYISLGSSNGTLSFIYADNTSNVIWTIDASSGRLSNGISGADLNLATTGTTLAVQEGTAASACSGTVTANGATPVTVSTTCAKTTQRLFLTKTSQSTVNGSCAQSAIVNSTSFEITCLATDTGTYNWVIFHEAA